MKFVLKSLRFLFLTILLLTIVLPAAFYILLSTDWAQEKICSYAGEEFSRLLGTEVAIGHVSLAPFERVHICETDIYDDNDSIAAHIGTIEARIEITELILRGKIVIDYATIKDIEAHLYRATPQSPLNIDRIISHLRSRKKKPTGSGIDLSLNNLTIRNGHICYDVLDIPATPGLFNASHIALDSLDLTVYAPRISGSEYMMELQHLSGSEQSGLVLSDLGFNLSLTHDRLLLSDFRLSMPRSHISLSTLQAPLTDGARSLGSLLSEIPVEVEVLEGSQLYLPDLKAFSPSLSALTPIISLHAKATASRDSMLLNVLSAETENSLSVMLSGNFYNLRQPDSIAYRDISFQVDAPMPALAETLSRAGIQLDNNLRKFLLRTSEARINGTADGNVDKGQTDITFSMARGNGVIVADYHRKQKGMYDVYGNISLDFPDAGAVASVDNLGEAGLKAGFSLTASRTGVEGEGVLFLERLFYRGHMYRDISISGAYRDRRLSARVESNDSEAAFSSLIDYADLGDNVHSLNLNLDIRHLSPTALFSGNDPEQTSYSLSSAIETEIIIAPGELNPAHESIKGNLKIDNFELLSSKGDEMKIPQISIDIDTSNPRGGLSVRSPLLCGEINGYLVPSALPGDILEIAGRCMPQLVISSERELSNSFVYDFTIDNALPLCHMFATGIEPVYPITLSGSVDASSGKASLMVDAPWLMQGDKAIENTVISASLNGLTGQSSLYATTLMPTKKGPMTLVARLDGDPGNIFTDIDWQIQRAIPINGKISFNTAINRQDDGSRGFAVDFRPSAINFGQDVWQLAPSTIVYGNKCLTVNNFSLSTATQRIDISTPTASIESNDEILISLTGVNLIDIFETLEINNALIGGHTSGEILLTDIFSPRPKLFSPCLHVKDISYNYCVLGDADVKMNYDNEHSAFMLDADIATPQGRHSRIFGSITPATEQLDITFVADKVKVGFLKPFMSAFSSDISGYASGRAHLFGTFKYIDLEGDIFADSVQVKIDFTNTVYTATDSIHLRPGSIDLHDITITDAEGNKALLNGVVKHTFFSAPVFDFSITKADNLLCYNVPEKLSATWFGKIYGDGSAHVHGHPGTVDIAINMTTKPRSTFTFVLSDLEEADEYSFIEFRDATPVAVVDSITEISTLPQAVIDYRQRRNAQSVSAPTAFNLDIQADVTPQAQVVIVMDPIGGDRIRAYGAGNLRMTYASLENDLRMYGTYTLERGDYNFTLQDIIIKDFTIQPGSSITFSGDPYSARLDLKAIYSVNANLSDLDESFLNDKELNRTNVPVHAVMNVTGDMRQPSVAFDLNFPTLTSDTYRKVRSIVSTDEMMNRQIIYLLALNRFYTPDYMGSTTRGNELFSVASATIGSQLGNMLGKLSENWSIAPNLRSERGDFSDIEVDLTLSSRLLNNRLLLGGNLGYRDKSLNTNRFVGDFDIEYLLGRRGNWRLKAYNRYNDQNYYLRTALTTQGIGIMYRRDFDNMFNFLKPKRKKNAETTDSIPDNDRK